jgi:phosphopantetheine adenylyltransferase
MRLRELFENIYEAGGDEDVAIIFGRFNPPHFGHVDAWKEAAKFPQWFVGTNQDTQGPKDPLPFDIKIEAMKTLYPEVEDHLVAEQSWLALAVMVYKKFGANVTLHIVTDPNDMKIHLPYLQKQNGLEGPHGYYRFKDVVWAKADRKTEAKLVRQAVKENNPQDFEKYSGVPADTMVAGHSYFKLVRHFMLPYMQAEEEKARKQQEREQQKAAKASAKAIKKPTPPVQQPDNEVPAEKVVETKERTISKRQQQASVGLNTFGDSEHMNADYTQYRLGLAVAMADGTNPIPDVGKTWHGKRKTTHPYTQEEQDMLLQAYKAVGANHKDLNKGNLKSMELDTTYKVSPVAKVKKNKYGV